ncbi:hypothetical protein SUGI_0804080 [Cryptomeria japonica]|uniref:aspartyl protease AED3-like n=1 Tax=Cryptomeria japonica TaxID=3369 RepID=UPI002414C4BF|nr:aspartyl protease AED3-like [Cryptomeria japonica]GLJ39376.1 hypothetical protein SUGI_0804080 [Cryptomeria japonica]
MAMLVLQSLALLSLSCCSSSSAESLESFKEEVGSNISTTNAGDITFPLISIHSDVSPFRLSNSTRSSRITEWLKSDTHRQQALFQIPLASGAATINGKYIIKLGFGTPAQNIYAIVDTVENAVWIPCKSCQNCKTPQLFESQKSSTFKHISCDSDQCEQANGICIDDDKSCTFKLGYADKYANESKVDALLSSDELTMEGNAYLSRFIFGCSTVRRGILEDAPGVIGLGRGSKLSFLSQTESMFGKVFSHCLPSIDSKSSSGTLSLGKGSLSSTQGLRFTPLLQNYPNYYCVGLIAIRVGNDHFLMPQEYSGSTPTGLQMVIDSGTAFTRLVEPFYSQVRDSFRRQMKLTRIEPFRNLDTCYRIPSGGKVVAPRVVLHFQGKLFLDIPQESVLITVDEKQEWFDVCFAFTSAGSGFDSVFGNTQQQKLRIVYDVPGSRIGIAQENCDH